MDSTFAGKPPYLVRDDIDRMPETPQRGGHHRRAHSETFFRFSDDILLDDVVADFNIDLPSPSSDIPMTTVDPSKSESSNGDQLPKLNKPVGPTNYQHLRSLSVDAGFFDGLSFTTSPAAAAAADGEDFERFGGRTAEKRMGHHRHSNSMDEYTTLSEAEMAMMLDSAKKAMGPDKLAELALMDPKRAKRILANRQSAARSKERKIRYTNELERKVQTLQTEATTLSAQVTLLQRDTTGLTAENKELKLRLQAMEQQAHLRDALNETLREEVQRLKIATGQIPSVIGNNFNRALMPQFSSHPQTLHHLGNQQSQQQPQQQQQQQLHLPHSAANSHSSGGLPKPDFLDFHQRV